MKHPLALLALLAALLLAPLATLPAAGAIEPSLNIVLIVADEPGSMQSSFTATAACARVSGSWCAIG